VGETVMIDRDELKAMLAEHAEAQIAKDVKSEPVLPHGDPGELGVKMGDSPEDKLIKSGNGGFEDMAHFTKEVFRSDTNRGSERMRDWDSAVRKTAGYMHEDGEDGEGHLIPVEFKAEIDKVALEESIARPRVRELPMATGILTIPVVNETSRASTFYGGVNMTWENEGATGTETKPTFGKIKLIASKLSGKVYISDEMMSDSPISVGPLVSGMFGEAQAFIIDEAILTGSGVGKPLGAFSASNPCLVSQAIESGQLADTIVTENILKMWMRLPAASKGKAIWVANNDTFLELSTLTIAVGTGGATVGLVKDATEGASATLLGRPLFLSEKMETLGDANDIGLCDLSKYYFGTKGSAKTASSTHVRFIYDETCFKFSIRVDGQPSLLSAVTPRKGANTLSPFVGLAERA